MAKSTVRIGILGAGTMARTHAAAYSTMEDVEVAGVFARRAGQARSVAGICGAEPAAAAETLILDDSVDAIDVCLPTALHPSAVIDALAQGKHIFCETPMALRLGEAEAMLQAARRAGRLLQVGLLVRSIAAYSHVREAAASGAHGRLLGLATWRLGSYLRPDTPDRKTHYSDPATELMTFDLDFANWLMGKPARLSAAGAGDVTALLDYADGRHATVSATGLMPRGAPFTVGFRALFEDAAFELHTVFDTMPPRSSFTVVAGGMAPQPVAVQDANPYEVELRRFVDCLRGEADPALLDAERAIEALTLSLATQRALAEGRPVEL